ncbi:glycosyltransferase family 2 protein [Marisediminicola sp. LYQ134]|uniref:glycosyltransferase family 2 protein n=1 Tax=Marisediminicola sp. LYQ134 TaxID=3391061 RepID=UPI003983AE2A
MPHSDLAVIVVNYRSSGLLEVNLGAVAGAEPDATVVVVDNFSDAGERSRVSELCSRRGWVSVLNDGNLGFGGGMNVGVDTAKALGHTTFLLLNPDAVIDSVSLRALVERIDEDDLVLASPIVTRPDGSSWFAGSDLYLDDGRVRSARRRHEVPGARTMPWLSGACLVISLRLWELIGGFDDRYFLYWEDIDLSRRVLAHGGTVEVVETATAIHAEGGTQGADGHQHSGQPKSAVYYYYNIRNRWLFAALHLPHNQQRAWARHSLPIAWEILLQGGRRQLLRSPRPAWAAIRGTLDGYVLARSLRRA